jgi:ferredoxin
MPTIDFRTSGCTVDFEEGSEVNLLRVAIRHECGVPYRCASGNCGTDRVHVEAGAENLSPVRRKERDRLGELIDQGWRLACQTYTSGDLTVTWSPDQKPLENERAAEKLRDRWLSQPDTAGQEEAS